MLTNAQRIQVMERSLRCFTFGLLGLIPAIGAAFGCTALILYFTARMQTADQWNPAGSYLNWGLGLAVLSLFQSVILVGSFIVALID